MLEPLVTILREATKQFPGIRYVWGAVAIAAAAGLIVKYLGETKTAIIIWCLAFLATILVTMFAGTSERGSKLDTPRQVLIYSTLIFFCTFLILTMSVFMGYGPKRWADFLGFDETKPKEFSVSGGSVNFGCERGATAFVEYRSPPGYRILNANAYPEDSSNAKAQTPYVYQNDGYLAKAKVDYFGKDRVAWNCPGGGHGKALLKGEIIQEEKNNLYIPGFSLAVASLIMLAAIFTGKRRSSDV
ncbi:hypothetical protein MKK58_01920 [Methylobacterium sp. J-078]|uniref:hypothetical protein n=1 Tax=Methylobacterium sp. J-078 TaxID=2836657 RepID=UPI001FBA8FDB|nr:hypothetical protein [Methylobacterium sp. J-078]MCJ2043310.1 hypothetical protein [Methylobacterium sp. J-078]